MTPVTFLLALVGLLLAVLGLLGGGNLPVMTLGIIALIAAGILEATGRRRS